MGKLWLGLGVPSALLIEILANGKPSCVSGGGFSTSLGPIGVLLVLAVAMGRLEVVVLWHDPSAFDDLFGDEVDAGLEGELSLSLL